MPTTTTAIIDTLRTTAPNLQTIGDTNGITAALNTIERTDGISPETVAARLSDMADATHVWADDNGHCLVLFKDADGNTYTDGDPFDWHDAHVTNRMVDREDAPDMNRMRCPARHKHIHSTADHVFYCEYDYPGWNRGCVCHQYVHRDCARPYRGDS